MLSDVSIRIYLLCAVGIGDVGGRIISILVLPSGSGFIEAIFCLSFSILSAYLPTALLCHAISHRAPSSESVIKKINPSSSTMSI